MTLAPSAAAAPLSPLPPPPPLLALPPTPAGVPLPAAAAVAAAAAAPHFVTFTANAATPTPPPPPLDLAVATPVPTPTPVPLGGAAAAVAAGGAPPSQAANSLGFFHDQVRHLHNHSHFRNLEEAHEQLVRDMILSHFGHSAVPTIMHHHFHHHHHHHMPLLDTAAETLDSVRVPLASLASLTLSLASRRQTNRVIYSIFIELSLAIYVCEPATLTSPPDLPPHSRS